MTRLKALALALALAVGPGMAQAACEARRFEGNSFTLCEAKTGDDLRLFLNDSQGQVLGSFSRANAQLGQEDKALAFAMNAGMYHRDRRPVGLYIENGETLAPIVTAGSAGNFGMRPNGVFCISSDGRFTIIESRIFAKQGPECRFATQSGPLLVIDGAYHSRFIPDSPSRLIRNGVGVSPDGARVYFVISSNRVNFMEFARFFRDGLGVQQALYFDGNISRLHAPALGRSDFGFPMGPIVGLVIDAP